MFRPTRSDVDLAKYRRALDGVNPIRREGIVSQVIGLTVEVSGISARLGDVCHLYPSRGARPVMAEVVGFRPDRALLMPLGEMHGIRSGSPVVAHGRPFTVPAGGALLGRVLDGLGRPIDGRGPVYGTTPHSVTNTPPHPLRRSRVQRPLETGVRAIDSLLMCGRGQRLGIFAGSGVGKSTLMGMIARNALSSVNVIALVGERGREVRDFVERDLGDGLARSVVVVSTSDQPALVRLRAALTATAIAEYFRDQGNDVTFLMDSVTRYAMAQREVGLAIGEPPASKGYTPSVFALLPKLMERAGTSERGTITAFYTVLVEGDDLTEPITDQVRSILDGHIVLSRQLAGEGHYPAIDVLGSVSRVMLEIADRDQLRAAARCRELLAAYQDARDLINIGAYVGGTNPLIDRAIELRPKLNAFLRQVPDERTAIEDSIRVLCHLCPPEEAA